MLLLFNFLTTLITKNIWKRTANNSHSVELLCSIFKLPLIYYSSKNCQCVCNEPVPLIKVVNIIQPLCCFAYHKHDIVKLLSLWVTLKYF